MPLELTLARDGRWLRLHLARSSWKLALLCRRNDDRWTRQGVGEDKQDFALTILLYQTQGLRMSLGEVVDRGCEIGHSFA